MKGEGKKKKEEEERGRRRKKEGKNQTEGTKKRRISKEN